MDLWIPRVFPKAFSIILTIPYDVLLIFKISTPYFNGMDFAWKVIKFSLPEPCIIYQPLHLTCAEGFSIYQVSQYLIILKDLCSSTDMVHHFQGEESKTRRGVNICPG